MVEVSLNFRLTVYLLKLFGLNGERAASTRKYCSFVCTAFVFLRQSILRSLRVITHWFLPDRTSNRTSSHFSIERLLDPKIEITRINLNRNYLRVSPVEQTCINASVYSSSTNIFPRVDICAFYSKLRSVLFMDDSC